MKNYLSFIRESKFDEDALISIIVNGKNIYFHIKYNEDKIPFEVKLVTHDGEYIDLSIKIPDSENLNRNEFFLNPEVESEIVDTLERENFIEESGKISVAGDKKTKSYILI